jgi:hypothetical protein
MHNLVYHYEIMLTVVKMLQKVRAEVYSLTIDTCSFAVYVKRLDHMHQQQTVETVRTKDTHTRKHQTTPLSRLLSFSASL